jgi:hypothetical protein
MMGQVDADHVKGSCVGGAIGGVVTNSASGSTDRRTFATLVVGRFGKGGPADNGDLLSHSFRLC